MMKMPGKNWMQTVKCRVNTDYRMSVTMTTAIYAMGMI